MVRIAFPKSTSLFADARLTLSFYFRKRDVTERFGSRKDPKRGREDLGNHRR